MRKMLEGSIRYTVRTWCLADLGTPDGFKTLNGLAKFGSAAGE